MAIPDFSDLSLNQLWSLADRNAVVTGAAQGLGKAIAFRLAEAGADVVLADYNVDLAKTAAQEIADKIGRKCLAVQLDVREAASVKNVVSEAVSHLGGVDIWVNNAGIFPNLPVFDMDEDVFDKVMDTNLKGTFLGAREAARHMMSRQSRGVIINILSVAAVRGIAPGLSAYVSSKHGALGLTKQLALELAQYDIRVLGVAPTYTPTEGTDAVAAKVDKTHIQSTKTFNLGRAGHPDDIARVVLFSASDMAAYMTGSTIFVDGGNTA